MDKRLGKRSTKVVSLPTRGERHLRKVREDLPSHEPIWEPLQCRTRGAEPRPWQRWLI